jgi:hypothetical protein
MRDWDFSTNEKFFKTYIIPYLERQQGKDDLPSGCDDNKCSVYTIDGMKYTVAECNGDICHIHVDVNNNAPPNTTGKDFFEFQFSKTDRGGIYRAETVQPATWGGAERLQRNNWQFTDALWNCKWTANGDNSACYK